MLHRRSPWPPRTTKDPQDAATAKPGFDPKPVQVGGESLVERLLPHIKKIVIGIVVIAVVLTVVFAFRYFKERDAAEGHREARAPCSTSPSARCASPAPSPTDPKAKEPTFANSKERANAVLDALDEGRHRPRRPAYKASLLLQAGKLDEAIAEYKQAHDGQDGLDGVLAREGLGIALEMKARAREGRRRAPEGPRGRARRVPGDAARRRRARATRTRSITRAASSRMLGKIAEAKAALEKAKEARQGAPSSPS